MTPKDVHDVLKKIGVQNLHHANTVTTSCTFLEESALLSRGYVESHRLKQTPQESDALDKKYGIWDRVFLDHVDIHYRGGRAKGPNQYGPVLFVFELKVLLGLPRGTNVQVTKMNPTHWTNKQKEGDRWYLSPDELAKNIGYGDFDKMLVITTPSGKVDFPNDPVQISLDDPNRKMSSGVDAYRHAEQRLKAAARKGEVVIDIASHQCRDGCICVPTYTSYSVPYFDSRFA
jgi:hypothetical protein